MLSCAKARCLAGRIASAVALICMCGCGDWPPVVESSADIQQLPVTEPSVRARGLADSDIPSLARLRDLEALDFWGGHAVKEAKITDSGLDELAQLDLPKLESLMFGDCDKITDAGMIYLGQMDNVKWLHLVACPHISDAGLRPLLKMKNLVALDLRGCPQITDAGLTVLAEKKDWEQISLGGCPNVSAEAVAELQRALPGARIEKDDQEWSYHKRK
jgi:hypothetical protein